MASRACTTSRCATPPAPGLADALRRLQAVGWPLRQLSDHGTHEAVYISDPDGNDLELAWDRPVEQWPRDERGADAADLRRPRPGRSPQRELSRSAASEASDSAAIVAAIGTAVPVPAIPASGAAAAPIHELQDAEQRRRAAGDPRVARERQRRRVREHEAHTRDEHPQGHEQRRQRQRADRHDRQQHATRGAGLDGERRSAAS